jgi:Fic family protein
MAADVGHDESGPISSAPLDAGDLSWPAHETEKRPWRQASRGGTVEDRTLDHVWVSLPPRILDLELWVPPSLATVIDDSTREIAALDATHGAHLEPLSALLLRSESVASSKIEQVEASVDDYARALHGIKSNHSATSMVASTRALAGLIDSVANGEAITLTKVTDAHRLLMAEDPSERTYAGRLRDMQNWIGGSDHSPRGAFYVPPPPEAVAAYMDDLMSFANRDDLPVMAQAAIAHAQFESIHPFTDGNGRIGRALINAILRRRGATSRVVVPLASALVARRDDYFDVLTDYRAGRAGPIVAAFASASAIASTEARVTAGRLAAMPDQWREAVGRVRAGSATASLLGVLGKQPVFSADDAEDLIGGATSSVYAAISRLHEAGVLRPLTNRTRNQIWGAADLLDELNDLGTRIEARARVRDLGHQ